MTNIKTYTKNQNKLYFGDNLDVLNHIKDTEYCGNIDLIYIDPPYCCSTDKKFGMIPWKKNTQPKNRVDEILPEIETLGGIDVANYLRWLYPRLYLMKELLSDKGSIYVHLDWHVGHYVKILMDEIFTKNNLVNEIIWCYKSGGVGEQGYAKKHDTILFYKKNNDFIFNTQKEKSYMMPWSGKNPAQTYYKDEKGTYTVVNVKDYWTDIGILATSSFERVGYATQKPETLLERIILASSNENSIVADFFGGSGTTGAVAEKLGRKWIMSDNNPEAIQTILKRIDNIKEI